VQFKKRKLISDEKKKKEKILLKISPKKNFTKFLKKFRFLFFIDFFGKGSNLRNLSDFLDWISSFKRIEVFFG